MGSKRYYFSHKNSLSTYIGAFVELTVSKILSNVFFITISPGIKPGYIVFPSHKNNVYIFSKAYCYLYGKRKFLAVRQGGRLDDQSRVPS